MTNDDNVDASTELFVRIASSLRGRTSIAGHQVARSQLAERMDELHVPAVSVAILDGGNVSAHAWGTNPATLFQAASISKPVAAMGAVRLARDGVLDLDANVNALLTSWRLPDGDAVTVRHLLCHAGALTVHGFPGYVRGTDVPTAVQILDGVAPANTEPVRVDGTPGESFRYSGGGYTLLQLLVEDVTGERFADVVRRRVLDPLGLSSSTYEQPLPADRWPLAAHGHDVAGAEIEGEWRIHPERAAAGLWTTPADLVGVAAEMIRPGAVLDPADRDEMLSAQVDDAHGLGWMLEGAWFQHGGSNIGFRCQLWASVERACAIAVMTNGDNGSAIAAEVVATAAEVLGWPDYLKARDVIEIDVPTLDGLVGSFEVQPGFDLVIRRDGNRLFSSIPPVFAEAELFAATPTEFFRLDVEATLRRTGDGFEIEVGGTTLTADRKPPAGA